MKEAAGEANMTVITIVLIAIVLAVGTIIVNSMMSNSGESSACASAGCTWQGGRCYRSESCHIGTNGKANCGTGSIEMACQNNNGTWTCQN